MLKYDYNAKHIFFSNFFKRFAAINSLSVGITSHLVMHMKNHAYVYLGTYLTFNYDRNLEKQARIL